MDLALLIRKGARQFGDRTAVVCEDRTQTYDELYERSCRVANALAALGVKKGDRVATLSDNCFETVEQMAGLALAGMVRSSLYTHNSADSNVYLLNAVDAVALIVARRHYDLIASGLPDASALRHVIVFDGEAPEGTLDYEQALAAARGSDPGITCASTDPHIIRFSAGTTGKPKGILHTLDGWRSVGTELALVMPRLTEEDRYLAAGPLSHAAVLPLAPTFAAGGSVVVMPAFAPVRFLELLERERCTLTVLVPTMVQMVIAAAHGTDVSSLRAVMYGAAPISDRTLEEAHAVWGNVMFQMYGQSEAVPLTVLTPADHVIGGSPDARRRLRSAGRPTPNTEIRIVDEDGSDVPSGETGEIAARTPAAMASIWRDPAASAARVLPDGSVLTRDIGYLDEDGYLFLADRKEDLIISGGFNIWPAELENALASHAAVAEVAVVGVPHERWGETPKAVVVLREGADATETELIDYTRDRLGSVKRVTSVEFADALPKTPIGKVLRREVRARFWAERERSVAGA